MNKLQKLDWNNCIKVVVFMVLSIFQLPLTGLETDPAEQPKRLSNRERISIIKEIILQKLDQNPDYIDPDQVLEEISQKMNLDMIQTEELQKIEKERQQKVLQKYPMTDEQLREKYLQEAENLFPLYNIGDEVEIHYLLHGKSFGITGVYYRSDPTYIWIGTKKIPRLNLARKYSIRFDADETAILRNQFVDKKLMEYHNIRSEYDKELTDRKYWIKSGCLYFYGQWVTPRKLAETRLKYLNEELRIRRMHQRIASEKTLSGRIAILQHVLAMIKIENLKGHSERTFEINTQLTDFKRRYVDSQIRLAQQEKDPERARIILQSVISKYPDAANIANAKFMLRDTESAVHAKNMEIQKRITVRRQTMGIRDKIVDITDKKSKDGSKDSSKKSSEESSKDTD